MIQLTNLSPLSKDKLEQPDSDDHKISDLQSLQVLDSRGNPTIEVDIWTKSGSFGRAIVPSGASTGVHEALELRDDDKDLYDGKGVLRAVSNAKEIIEPKIIGRDCTKQDELDRIMIALDGSPNKKNLGANTILAVSMAVARVASSSKGIPLYESLNPLEKYRLPVPMMNIINGGKHAGNQLTIQECLIEPIGAKTCTEAIRFGVEVYHALKDVLGEKYGASATNVGDEGGYAPPISNTAEALDVVLAAISKSGYSESDIRLGFDAAASEFYDAKKSQYNIDGRTLTSEELEDYYLNLVDTYPILSIEDPFEQEAFSDFARMTKKLGNRIKIIGDDLYVTNTKRIKKGIETKATNAALIKLNQIGTVTETLEAIGVSKSAGFEVIVSHRSGETEDTFIAHLATAVGSTFIKAGAPARGERTAKYNELLRIEKELGNRAYFAGRG
jgi:enolase